MMARVARFDARGRLRFRGITVSPLSPMRRSAALPFDFGSCVRLGHTPDAGYIRFVPKSRYKIISVILEISLDAQFIFQYLLKYEET
jgi:hypothetical protein